MLPLTNPRGCAQALNHRIYRQPQQLSRKLFLSDEGDHTVITFEGSAPVDKADEVERGWAARLDAVIAGAQTSQSGGNAGGIRPG